MITPQKMVEVLNELMTADSFAMHELVETRVACNEALADHPTVPVMSVSQFPDCKRQAHFPGLTSCVGLLGVLNGIAALDGEVIEGCYNQDEQLIRFELRQKVPNGDTRVQSGHGPELRETVTQPEDPRE